MNQQRRKTSDESVTSISSVLASVEPLIESTEGVAE